MLYGWVMLQAMNAVAGRVITFGSLYPTLQRMEKKCLVQSRWGEYAADDAGGARGCLHRSGWNSPYGHACFNMPIEAVEDLHEPVNGKP